MKKLILAIAGATLGLSALFATAGPSLLGTPAGHQADVEAGAQSDIGWP